MKLLAKNAEERYQTAAGLEADLRRCLWNGSLRVALILSAWGAMTHSDRLLIPEKLYGREREIDALVAAFDRVVAQGTPEARPRIRYSGVGKSQWYTSCTRRLFPPRGFFAAGKFDQYTVIFRTRPCRHSRV